METTRMAVTLLVVLVTLSVSQARSVRSLGDIDGGIFYPDTRSDLENDLYGDTSFDSDAGDLDPIFTDMTLEPGKRSDLAGPPSAVDLTKDQRRRIFEELQEFPRWRQRLNKVEQTEGRYGHARGRLSVGLEVDALSSMITNTRARMQNRRDTEAAIQELRALGKR